MKIKISLSKFIVISLLILGIFVILSVGIDLISKFSIGWSKAFILKFNNVILNLSYSYVAGMIFYILINYFPDQVQKRRFQPFVKRDIKRIHSLYIDLINSMSKKKDGVVYEIIPEYYLFEELMECISPNELYPETKGQITEATYLRTFLYIKLETLDIIKHIHLFKKQVPDKIILLLEDLIGSEFFKVVIMWNSFKSKIGNGNMKIFAESFYDGFDIVKKLNKEANKLH